LIATVVRGEQHECGVENKLDRKEISFLSTTQIIKARNLPGKHEIIAAKLFPFRRWNAPRVEPCAAKYPNSVVLCPQEPLHTGHSIAI